MPVRVGINGFGRIGRNVFRASRGCTALEFVAVNDVMEVKTAAHLLRHDSILGAYPGVVETGEHSLLVDGHELKVLSVHSPGDLPWRDLGVELVIESSGLFTHADQARLHITEGGARKVIISAPAEAEDITVCMGVNQGQYDPQRHQVISNASCTTNCLAPVAMVLDQEFGIESGLLTTAHAYTGDQRLLDAAHKDLRRARAAAVSLIPTSTGAAKAVGLVLPQLAGRLTGMALRVPAPDVSLVDLTVVLSRAVTVEEVNQALRRAAQGPLQGIMSVTDEELVSIDFRGDPHSAIVDAPLTMLVGDRHLKVFAWYDNEWGYSRRVVELAEYVAATLPEARN